MIEKDSRISVRGVLSWIIIIVAFFVALWFLFVAILHLRLPNYFEPKPVPIIEVIINR